MSKRNYERLPIEKFGRQLITSGDLDPVYIALPVIGRDKSVAQMHRWLIAYWCFYHCGFASYASEFSKSAFFDCLMEAAKNETEAPPGGRWPRGHERRHARGEQGQRMVLDLMRRYQHQPEKMVHNFSKLGSNGIPFKAFANDVQEHVLFGPWIAFKIADMMERIIGCNISFDNAAVFMFKDPTKAALMLWRHKHGYDENVKPRDQGAVIEGVVAFLKERFSDLTAPPHDDRAIGLQEVETVLCKWKSHMNGHYPLFNDIDEIRTGLDGWGKTAKLFKSAMPEGSSE